MERGDIYRVSLEPTSGHEQRGHRPVMVVSPKAFNALTKTPKTGTVTSGVVRCDQPRAMDLASRRATRVERAPDAVVGEVLAKLRTLLE